CVGGTLQDTCTPGAPSAEICDSMDNDCDGQADEGVTQTFYRDADGDTYGNIAITVDACSAPVGYVTNSTDCDDSNAGTHPGATEICGNSIDEDCNGADPVCDDTVPPAITCPANIQVDLECGGTPSSSVAIHAFLNAATATDNVDGAVPVTNNAPGIFTPGVTVVTFTATDSSGNTSSCQASVHVKYVYSGILQPINADGSSVFKIGRAVPVKFKLYCSGTTPVGAATATLSVFKVTNVVTGTVTEVETVPVGEANTGNLFRYDPVEQQYIYNWSTKGLTAGTYQLRISLNDATTYNANLSLKVR
ncbi:PxKF domain-containing protein, partial [Candidatus Poribacteria bacterium]|nr:PxKF domain-containing protein [Candidatus Poribacteria bacterium]